MSEYLLSTVKGCQDTGRCLHILVSEYPPQTGGVGDYTHRLAGWLAAANWKIHIWCPETSGAAPEVAGVTVHRFASGFAPADLRKLGRALDQFDKPRRLLVQWVPHGYGFRSMNLPFCLWLSFRSLRKQDHIELMVHEAYLAFHEGNWRQDAAAFVHRLMTIIILISPRRIWMATSSWERLLRPYLLKKRTPFYSLPVPSNIPVVDAPEEIDTLRKQFTDRPIWGHFGTYGSNMRSALDPLFSRLLREERGSLVLMGKGSDTYRLHLLAGHPEWEPRIYATGQASPDQLSIHLAACDILIQPYPDGASCRRGSLMAAIAHGKPVVSNVGRNTEPVWVDAGAVSLAPRSETGLLFALCRKLLTDQRERDRLGEAAGELYRHQFDWPKTVSKILALET